MSVKKTFRFDDKMADELGVLTKAWGVDQTEAIRRSIQLAIKSIDDSADDTRQKTDESRTRIAALEATVRELRESQAHDRAMLDKALDTVDKLASATTQAQVLHAADKVEALPEMGTETEPLTRWEHFKAAFRRRH